MVEALGIALPDNAAIPAVDARRSVLAQHDRTPDRRDGQRGRAPVADPHQKAAFENAIRVNGAIGGSTNAVLHLLAIAGRIGTI
jgi:L-arabonate dehydrase